MRTSRNEPHDPKQRSASTTIGELIGRVRDEGLRLALEKEVKRLQGIRTEGFGIIIAH